MKRLVLMMIPALICGTALTGCSDKAGPKEEKTAGGLYVIGSKSASVKAGDKTDLVFTGDDIVSFNVSNGEIVFTEAKKDEIISRVSLHTELHFFIDDQPVFTPPIRIYFGWDVLFDDFDLQFRTDGERIFLTDIYMSLDSVPFPEREMAQQEIDAKKEERKAELDVLIKYLSDAGKIAEQEAGIPEEIRTGCDVLYFADSLNFVNWVINGAHITGFYPEGIDLSSIETYMIISEKASVNPQPGITDFSNGREITYTVTAEDGTVKIYTAQAKVESEEQLTVEQLKSTPENIVVSDKKLMLETYLWRDFMPDSEPNGTPLMGVIRFIGENGDILSNTISISKIYVIDNDKIWTCDIFETNITYNNLLEVVFRNGPKWGPGINVDVICEFENHVQLYRIMAKSQKIHATY